MTDFEEKHHFMAFELLLRTHAPTLESLQFILPPAKKDSVLIIQLPAFPMLKNLNIGCNLVWQSNEQNFSFGFPGHEEYVNYEKYFPSLQKLTLWPVDYGKYPPVERSYTYFDSVNYFWEKHENVRTPHLLTLFPLV